MKKEILEQYVFLKAELENQLERIARAKNDSEIHHTKLLGEILQHQMVTGDQLGTAVIRWLDLAERLRPSIEANITQMKEIEDSIDNLSDPLEREILRMRYLEGEYRRLTPWKIIAIKIYGGDEEKHMRSVQRLHKRAIEHIEEL